MDDQNENPIAKAVSQLGGLTAVANALVDAGLVKAGRMSPQNIYKWVKRGYAPPRYVCWLEERTGIPREQLVAPELADLFVGICDDDE